jgi:DNA-binding response OmpR family regulator
MTRAPSALATQLLATAAGVVEHTRMLQQEAEALRAENAALLRERDDLLAFLEAATQALPDRRLPRRRPAGRTPVPLEAARGGLTLDRAARHAFAGGQRIPLSPIEFELLAYLLDYFGQPVSKEAILRAVWPGSADNDLRTVRVHVSGIRAKLERCVGLPVRLTTLHSFGYRIDLTDDSG